VLSVASIENENWTRQSSSLLSKLFPRIIDAANIDFNGFAPGAMEIPCDNSFEIVPVPIATPGPGAGVLALASLIPSSVWPDRAFPEEAQLSPNGRHI
jgi:hypothetical protein